MLFVEIHPKWNVEYVLKDSMSLSHARTVHTTVAETVWNDTCVSVGEINVWSARNQLMILARVDLEMRVQTLPIPIQVHVDQAILILEPILHTFRSTLLRSKWNYVDQLIVVGNHSSRELISMLKIKKNTHAWCNF